MTAKARQAHAIDKPTYRAKLGDRREPYWGARIAVGLYLGVRVGDDQWWIARLRDDAGKQKYESLGRVSPDFDYLAAVAKAKEWARQQAAGVDAAECRTIADACKLYAENRRSTKGEATAHDAELRFTRTVNNDGSIGSIALDKIRQTRLEKWVNSLIDPNGDHKLSKASANRTLTSLKAALNYACDRRYVTRDREQEWASVKPFKNAGTRRSLFLNTEQRRALLTAATGAVHDLIEAAARTGARPGELVKLLRRDFDAESGELRLNGKTGARTITLPPSTVAFFKRLAKSKLPGAYLLTRDDGKHWAPSDWDVLVRDAATAAKLPPGVCLYTLRHSFITEVLKEGTLDLLSCARFVGTSATMIEKHYGHLVAHHARDRLALVSLV